VGSVRCASAGEKGDIFHKLIRMSTPYPLVTPRPCFRPARRLLAVLAVALPFLLPSAALGQTGTTEPPARRALLQQALDLEEAGQKDAALLRYREALADATARRDSALVSDVTYNLGLLHWSTYRFDSALVHLERTLLIRQQRRDTIGVGRVLNSLGATYYQLGNYEPAVRAFLGALEARRAEGDSAGVARVLTNLGKAYQDWGQLERALRVLTDAVTAARSARSPATLGYSLNSLAQLHLDRGAHAEAQEAMTASMAAYTAPGVSPSDSAGGWALNADVRGVLLARTSAPLAAIAVLDSARAVSVQRGSVRGEARALLHQGEAYLELKEVARARTAFARSLSLSQGVAQRMLALQALRRMADAEELAGEYQAALRTQRAFRALRDTIFNEAGAQRIAAEEADRATAREQLENARLQNAQREQRAVIARQRLAVGYTLLVLALAAVVVAVLGRKNRALAARETALARTNDDLRRALSEVRTLSGLIPICASCKRIRDDQGYWQAVESWLASHSDAQFSHAICQHCGPTLYGDDWPEPDPGPAPTSDPANRRSQ
jgi:tetratricopeptide (TPR) repeat protein